MVNKRWMVIALVFGALITTSCQQRTDVKPTNDEERVLYSLGAIFGQRLEQLDLSEKDADMLLQGLRDQVIGRDLHVNPDEYQDKIAEVLQGRIEGQARAEKERGQAFIQNFVQSQGGTLTDSGLAYKIIEEGEGRKPRAEDIVEVSYEGRLIDGTVFDASESPVTFPLNRVVSGWTEGLQKIAEGGSMQLVIPSDLAYGDSGFPPQIPGGATLVFDVQLHSVQSAD